MLLSDGIFTITNRGVIRFLFCFTQHYHIFLIIFLYTLLTNGSRNLSGELPMVVRFLEACVRSPIATPHCPVISQSMSPIGK